MISDKMVSNMLIACFYVKKTVQEMGDTYKQRHIFIFVYKNKNVYASIQISLYLNIYICVYTKKHVYMYKTNTH